MSYHNSGVQAVVLLLLLEYIFRRRMFNRCMKTIEHEKKVQEQEIKILREHVTKLSREIQDIKRRQSS